jgi:hypothetical protein
MTGSRIMIARLGEDRGSGRLHGLDNGTGGAGC